MNAKWKESERNIKEYEMNMKGNEYNERKIKGQ